MEEEFLKLIFENKGLECCKKIYQLHQRLPKIFSASTARQIILFLTNFPSSFVAQSSHSFLFRLLVAQYKLAQKAESGSSQLFAKVLKKERSSVGFVVAVNHLKKYESFTHEHIIQGIHYLISGVRPVKGSFQTFTYKKTRLFYIEIKKVRGGFFTPEELEKLNATLTPTLKEKIERIFKPIVIPDIEENTFKQIRQLSNELTHPEDLPQIAISFSEYSERSLTFIVTIMRILHEKAIPLTAIISHSPSVEVSLENAFIVEHMNKKYPKEASIFKIKLNPSLCTQEKKVDLRAGRQYVKKILENALGEVRDFNGGLLIKEEEQLEILQQACSQAGIRSFYLEDIFYEIHPPALRPLVTSQTGTHLLQSLYRILNNPIPDNLQHCSETFSSPETEIFIVKTKQTNWLSQIATALPLSKRQIGYTHLHKGGDEYLCFFEQYPPTKNFLIETIKRELQQLYHGDAHTFLHLNLQGGDLSSLNPRLASDIHCHTLSTLLFEGLTRINRKGDPELAQAASIETSPSGLEYTFHLRASAWSNGDEVTAYDFERSWKKALMNSVPSFLCPKLFYTLKNARKAREGELPLDSVGVQAKDKKTLCIKLEKPCEYFLHLVSTPLFFPLHGESEEPKHFNGPFYLEEWKHDHYIILSRNPFYWNVTNVKINGIKFFMENDIKNIYTKFRNKELDIIGDPLSPLNPSILKKEQHHLISKHISRVFWIHCNRHVFPLHHKKIRQALNYALNRKKIARDIFYQQQPHASPLPRAYALAHFNLEGEPELAKNLFEQALHELKLDRHAFPTLELIHSNLTFERDLAVELKRQWKDVLGVDLITKELSWSDFSSALEKGTFQLGGLFRRDLFNHPQYYLSFFRQASLNPHSLDNPEYEKLFSKIDSDKNNTEAVARIEQLLIEEAPVFPLVNQVCFGLVQEHVKGVSWSLDGCLNLNKVFFDENIKSFACV